MLSAFLLDNVIGDFIEVREKTMDFFSPIDIEDAVIQSGPLEARLIGIFLM